MIEAPKILRSHDRLTAFLNIFGLRAETRPSDRADTANLFVIVADPLQPTHIVFRCRGGASGLDATILACARINFGGAMNPLIGALPEELRFAVDEFPPMQALAELFLSEIAMSRCGGATVRDRLCEVIVVFAVRRAIANGTVNAGLLAGLAHEEICPCLIAIHDEPARAWRVEDLARIAGMSRSHFTEKFSKIVGMSPASYVTSWRLTVGYSRLKGGGRVKSVASEVGFGSQEAFSRAFSRAYGYPPSALR